MWFCFVVSQRVCSGYNDLGWHLCQALMSGDHTNIKVIFPRWWNESWDPEPLLATLPTSNLPFLVSAGGVRPRAEADSLWRGPLSRPGRRAGKTHGKISREKSWSQWSPKTQQGLRDTMPQMNFEDPARTRSWNEHQIASSEHLRWI